MVRTFQLVAHLPVDIESYELEVLEKQVSGGFRRATTIVRLIGAGETGLGEEVTWEHEDLRSLIDGPPLQRLCGKYVLSDFCRHLDRCELFPVEPAHYATRQYRRWAFESAALDLALRQAGRPLCAVLGRPPSPVRFVVSLRFAEPPSIAPIDDLLGHYPNLRFKLDPTSSWSERLCRALAALRKVDVLDLKGSYEGTPVDTAPDAALYRRVARAFPDAWLEDPHLDSNTAKALLEHRDRITWDAPIHSVADIEALPFPPKMLNFKPSRFGTLENLFDAYDYCDRAGIRMYGGGQFELGPGRGQIQYLASLFHPSAPNDVAPVGFNDPRPGPGLPRSPLAPRFEPTGLRWAALPVS